MSIDDWRSKAAVMARRTLNDTIAGLEATAGTGEEKDRRASEWRERTARARKREGLPSWAPLDVCGLYFGNDPDSPFAMDERRKHLRLLLSAPVMKAVWARLENHGINPILFATTACGATDAVGTWQALSKAQRARKCLEIANCARALERLLSESPAAFHSIFRYIPDEPAERIASHCMDNPAQLIWRVAHDAQDAIEDALPSACTVRTSLGVLAERAERWAANRSGYGRSDDSQDARAFVVRLATFLRDECGDPLLEIVGECCSVLKGTHFEPNQLRGMTGTQLVRRSQA